MRWFIILIDSEASQRRALLALGQGRRSRPARKMKRRRKLPEIGAYHPTRQVHALLGAVLLL